MEEVLLATTIVRVGILLSMIGAAGVTDTDTAISTHLIELS